MGLRGGRRVSRRCARSGSGCGCTARNRVSTTEWRGREYGYRHGGRYRACYQARSGYARQVRQSCPYQWGAPVVVIRDEGTHSLWVKLCTFLLTQNSEGVLVCCAYGRSGRP